MVARGYRAAYRMRCGSVERLREGQIFNFTILGLKRWKRTGSRMTRAVEMCRYQQGFHVPL